MRVKGLIALFSVLIISSGTEVPLYAQKGAGVGDKNVSIVLPLATSERVKFGANKLSQSLKEV